MNPRKDKILKKMWMTQAEEESLRESLILLNSGNSQDIEYAKENITEIVEELNRRGDLIN